MNQKDGQRKVRGTWVFFVSRRFLRSRRKSRSNVTSVLSVLGLAAGVLTLVTVLSVMNGFQLSTIEDLVELNSYHIRIGNWAEYSSANPGLAAEIGSLPEVIVSGEIIESQALVQGMFSSSQAIILKAMDEAIYRDDTDFLEGLSINRDMQPDAGEIVLGTELARSLRVGLGDSLEVISLGGSDVNLSRPVEISLTVSGIFESGYYEFDRSWGLISPVTARESFGAGYRAEYAIKVANRYQDVRTIGALLEAFPEIDSADVSSWREYNRSIFGALRVEKSMMTFLVGLIFLVVGVNIYQGLRRAVHERIGEIAVLKVMGASDLQVRRVFILEGVIIGAAGTVAGLILGVLITTHINEIFAFAEYIVGIIQSRGDFRIFSPSYFYLQSVPSQIVVGELIFIAVLSFGSAGISAFLASRRIVELKPREVLNDD